MMCLLARAHLLILTVTLNRPLKVKKYKCFLRCGAFLKRCKLFHATPLNDLVHAKYMKASLFHCFTKSYLFYFGDNFSTCKTTHYIIFSLFNSIVSYRTTNTKGITSVIL